MINVHYYDDHYHYSDDEDDMPIDTPCRDCGSGDHSTGACQ